MNQVILIGRVGNEPKNYAKETENAIVGFSLATNEYYQDKQGQRVELTEWHNVIAFNHLGTFVLSQVSKGDKVVIVGKIKTKKYLDNNGIERYSTNINAESIDIFKPNKQ